MTNKHLVLAVILSFLLPLAAAGQSCLDAFKRAGESHRYKKNYQYSLDSYHAALTCTDEYPEERSLRDSISKIEATYRKHLKSELKKARNIEKSIELTLRALTLEKETGDSPLALLLLDEACELSGNSNLIALKERNKRLVEARFAIPEVLPTGFQASHLLPFDSMVLAVGVFNQGDRNENIILRNWKRKSEAGAIRIPTNEDIVSLATSGKHDWMLAVNASGKVYKITVSKQFELSSTLLNVEGKVTAAAISSSGNFFALGFQDGMVRVYEKNAQTANSSFATYADEKTVINAVNWLAFAPGNDAAQSKKLTLLAPRDQKAARWEINTKKPGKIKKPKAVFPAFATAASLSNDGATLLSWDMVGAATLWQASNEKKISAFQFPSLNGNLGDWFASLSSDGSRILLTQANAKVAAQLDLNGNVLDYYRHGVEQVTAAAFWHSGNDEMHIVTGGGDGAMRRWKGTQTPSSDNTAVMPSNLRMIRLTPFEHKGAYVTKDNAIYLWDFLENTAISQYEKIGKKDTLMDMAISPGGKFLLTASKNEGALLFKAENMENPQKLSLSEHEVTALTWSPCHEGPGNYFAVAYHSTKNNTYSISTYSGTGVLKKNIACDATVTALAISPTGDTLMTGKDNGVLEYRSGNTLELLPADLGHEQGQVVKVAFSKHGRKALALTKTKDGYTHLDLINNVPDTVNIANQRKMHYESAEELDLTYAAFSADEKYMLLTKEQETVLLSTEFLKPGYELFTLPSLFGNDHLQEAYLLDSNTHILTISVNGNVGVQENKFNTFQKSRQEIPPSVKFEYRIANLEDYKEAQSEAELKTAWRNLVELLGDSEEDEGEIINLLVAKLLKLDSMTHGAKIANHLMTMQTPGSSSGNEALVEIKNNTSESELPTLEKAEIWWDLCWVLRYKASLMFDQGAGQIIPMLDTAKLSRDYGMKALSYFEKENFQLQHRSAIQAMRSSLRETYLTMSWLAIFAGQFDKAVVYSDSSLYFDAEYETCFGIAKTNKALALLLKGENDKAFKIYKTEAFSKCVDIEGHETFLQAFRADLDDALSFFNDGKHGRFISQINEGYKYLNKLKPPTPVKDKVQK